MGARGWFKFCRLGFLKDQLKHFVANIRSDDKSSTILLVETNFLPKKRLDKTRKQCDPSLRLRISQFLKLQVLVLFRCPFEKVHYTGSLGSKARLRATNH